MNRNQGDTPLMRQYNEIKSKYPHAVLLFRVGDFYETFGEDAIKISKILGIVLTKRNTGFPSETELAGFPFHSLNTYLPKLVNTGCRVAICEQLEEPRKDRKIVKRGVVDLVTPGIRFDDNTLERNEHNFLASIYCGKKLGIALLDIAVGLFLISEGSEEEIIQLLGKINPSEVIIPKPQKENFSKTFGSGYHYQALMDWSFDLDTARSTLKEQFQTHGLEGFGINEMEEAIRASGAVLHYLKENHQNKLKHITRIQKIDNSEYLSLDLFTLKNLEVFSPTSIGGISLIDVIDHTKTPMGARMIRNWLRFPLKNIKQIERRHHLIKEFSEQQLLLEETRDQLEQISDVERSVSKIATGKITPRQIVHLSKSLSIFLTIRDTILKSKSEQIKSLFSTWEDPSSIIEMIEKALMTDPSQSVAKGDVMADGFNDELDELRSLRISVDERLKQMLQLEIERTNIPNLKISFNQVIGYFFEIRNTHVDKVPDRWMRKQSLINVSRFVDEDLKEFEEKILNSQEQIQQLESTLYNDFIKSLSTKIEVLLNNAELFATLDCLSNFAYVALKNSYVQPEINPGPVIDIKGARHPVIEIELELGTPFISNDILVDKEKQQIIMITGPNMSGKSAILRQTALICLLSQAGSFVPATVAILPIVDKIFTRVGASDNISIGASTFMVEMNETAFILNNLTEKSLILLDEIGRGTSTYDGISIAWAITNYLHEHPYKPWVLFATHYHELNEIANSLNRVKNYNVSVKEGKEKVIFLRRLVPGGSAHSFGIHVAKMAGLPKYVIDLAKQKLELMEQEQPSDKVQVNNAKRNVQLTLFEPDNPKLKLLRETISKIDIDNITPIESLLHLREFRKKVLEILSE